MIIKKKRYFMIFLTLILFSISIQLTFAYNEINISNYTIKFDSSDDIIYNQYIVELNENPLLSDKNDNLYKKVEKLIFGEDFLINNNQNDFIETYKEKYGDFTVKTKWKNLINGMLISSNLSIEEIKKLPGVKNVYLDIEVHIELQQSVPLIGADQVWSLQNSTGSNITGLGVRVAILDTGIDYTNTNFGGCTQEQIITYTCPKILYSWDFINSDADVFDDHGHGTHVAGIVGANGALKGVAPNSTLLIYKVLSDSGSGSSSGIISAIENATLNGAEVISMSLGGGGWSDSWGSVIKNAVDNGVTVVVAAGNSGGAGYGTVGSPGSDKYSLTVGASDKSDIIAGFSSIGFAYYYNHSISSIKPDILAPGVSINSTVPTGSCYICNPSGYISISGTSMATPMVAGSVALLKQMHPTWTPIMIKSALSNRAKDIGYEPNIQGSGRIDIPNTINTTTFINPNNFVFELPTNSSIFNMSLNITIKNIDTITHNYNIIENFSQIGLNLSYNNTFSIASDESLNITITLTVNESLFGSGQYHGKLTLNSTDGIEILPFYVAYFPDKSPNFYNKNDNSGTLIDNGTGNFYINVNNSKPTVFWCLENLCYQATNLISDTYTYSKYFDSSGTYPYFWLTWWYYSMDTYYSSDTYNYVVNSNESGGDCNLTSGSNWVISTNCTFNSNMYNPGYNLTIINTILNLNSNLTINQIFLINSSITKSTNGAIILP